MNLLRLACAATLLLLVACSAKDRSTPTPTPGLQPPPDSGQVAIDMDGMWVVDSFARVDSAEPPPGPDPLALPFLAIQEGQAISIADGRAYDAATSQLLYATWNPSVPNVRYENQADDRFWRFLVEFFDTQGCVTDLEIEASFGTQDTDTLIGFVAVRYVSSCPAPQVLRPNPNGMFGVVLKRVVPATLGR
jgi:hypothetical protein